MTFDCTRRTALKTIALGAAGVAGSAVGTPATAADGPERLFSWDPSAGELPENVAVDRRGRKYVSFAPRGELRRISADNRSESTLGSLEVGTGNGLLGLEVHPNGTLFACLVSFDSPGSDTHGVWRRPRDGDLAPFAPVSPSRFPNDVLLDGHSVLVTDSVGGAVLRVGENRVTEWVADPLLEGDGSLGLPFPIGANGIARASDGTVYVANTERGRIVEVPVRPDGTPGTPRVFAEDPRLLVSDGLAIDVEDDLYVAVIGQDTVLRVAQDGSIETLATAADGLDDPSDVTFGTSRGEQTALFVTNFALISREDPSLMKLDIGVPGRPIRP